MITLPQTAVSLTSAASPKARKLSCQTRLPNLTHAGCRKPESPVGKSRSWAPPCAPSPPSEGTCPSSRRSTALTIAKGSCTGFLWVLGACPDGSVRGAPHGFRVWGVRIREGSSRYIILGSTARFHSDQWAYVVDALAAKGSAMVGLGLVCMHNRERCMDPESKLAQSFADVCCLHKSNQNPAPTP